MCVQAQWEPVVGLVACRCAFVLVHQVGLSMCYTSKIDNQKIRQSVCWKCSLWLLSRVQGVLVSLFKRHCAAEKVVTCLCVCVWAISLETFSDAGHAFEMCTLVRCMLQQRSFLAVVAAVKEQRLCVVRSLACNTVLNRTPISQQEPCLHSHCC